MNKIKTLIIVSLSFLAGVFYRMGGSGNYPRWTRHAGLAVTCIIVLWLLGYHHWTSFLSGGLLYGASTTYFKRKGTDAYWYNWFFVGLAFSLSVLPVVVVYADWFGFILRTFFCTVLVVAWSEYQSKDVLEEFGRGFIAIATLPLLSIGAA